MTVLAVLNLLTFVRRPAIRISAQAGFLHMMFAIRRYLIAVIVALARCPPRMNAVMVFRQKMNVIREITRRIIVPLLLCIQINVNQACQVMIIALTMETLLLTSAQMGILPNLISVPRMATMLLVIIVLGAAPRMVLIRACLMEQVMSALVNSPLLIPIIANLRGRTRIHAQMVVLMSVLMEQTTFFPI
ncbi:MAG: hypothetical protein PHV28_03905 [Kiritimatiellae bacterium]|nr:hypothetical protein [Kiritimatiellia bacterium]